jgi:hypothetical protein
MILGFDEICKSIKKEKTVSNENDDTDEDDEMEIAD